ncbi:AraC family transcriptional regulator [Marinobacterium marinum]|uniref:Helix-turn-helix transcriptional regulator n=1 Tax=Marinobacterium marinum TaxID=2756129 RepID=A0A7W1WZF0_9GAMM|nr:helix-turn-helix transcriptional regulator [Marinobacterium marinum]MBA4503060.1 helix-turn-helix transcriptional regulator [Marinobacterium marinum]
MSNIYQPPARHPGDGRQVFFYYQQFSPDTLTPMHSHEWGQLQLSRGGLMELEAQGQRFMSLSQCGIWIPPGVRHEGYMRRCVQYSSMNVPLERAATLPNHICLLELSPISETILTDLRLRGIELAQTPADERLLAVLLDQLSQSREVQPFLPVTDHPMLQAITTELEILPEGGRSFSAWADTLGTTERTLARICLAQLGMNYTEWRQRHRFIHGLQLLRQDISVKEVALTLGYHQTSPFISLFRKYAGCTPQAYRQQLAQGTAAALPR